MQENTPQVPITQEAKPEVKGVPQTPQQSPVVPQTPLKPTPPTKPKKWLKTKILIILIALVSLVTGGFFVWKNVFVPEEVYKGIWLFGLPPNWLASNVEKMKDIGINTAFLEVIIFETDGNRVGGIDTSHTVADIQTAHENGLKVALTTGFAPKPKWEDVDIELLNSKIIELAELAEEYDVEFFAPLNEPDMPNTGRWRQEILHKIKEVYHGEIIWKGAGVGLPDKATISEIAEQPPGDFSGYDYIGFSSMYMPEEFLEPEELSQYADRLTLEGYSEYFEGVLDYVLAQAERDGVKGVMITEFGVMHVFDQGSWNEEEVARAYEIVLEKGKGKVAGFIAFNFLEIELSGNVPPEFLVHLKGSPKTEEVIRRWFREIL